MNTQNLITAFHKKSFKATPQRLAICKFVLSSKEHPSADYAYKEIKKNYPKLSLATVYQTFHLLTELGLLQELESDGKTSRYDPDTSPHINIICRKCGKIEDYRDENIEAFWTKLKSQLKFMPTGQRFDVYRFCEKCLKKSI
jgi:Fur family transcriptional regulator, peroxide stress response regulator